MSCSVSTNKVQHIWEQELKNLEDWLPKKQKLISQFKNYLLLKETTYLAERGNPLQM